MPLKGTRLESLFISEQVVVTSCQHDFQSCNSECSYQAIWSFSFGIPKADCISKLVFPNQFLQLLSEKQNRVQPFCHQC